MEVDNFMLALQEDESLGRTAMESDGSTPTGGRAFDNQVQRYLKAAVRRHDLTARRNRTLASVLQEWTEVGFAKAQVASIANRAGMSTASLYQQFQDKRILFCEALSFGHAILLDALATYRKDPNPIRDLTAMLCNYIETLSEPAPQQMLIAQSSMLLDPEFQADVRAIANENHAKIKQIWYAKVQKWADAGWVRLDQFEAQRCHLASAFEIQSVPCFKMGSIANAPEGNWPADVQQVVCDFFKLYGTEKFKQQKVLSNSDLDIAAF